MRRSIALSLSIMGFCLICVGCSYTQGMFPKRPASTELNQARDTFTEAWEATKKEYVDNSLNHQDWNYWYKRYIHKISTREDAYLAIQSMIYSLNDKYTRFLTPDEFKEQDEGIEANISGIGVQIGHKSGKILIVSVLEHTPAFKAGLLAHDEIVKVNTESVKGLDLRETARLIRGKIGTIVNLTIVRGKQSINYSVQRDKIQVNAVSQKIIDNNISYIKLYTFLSQRADVEMYEAIKKSSQSRGLILDLRGNYGGLLPNAISIANFFLHEGTIVSVVNKNGVIDKYDAVPGILTDKPLVILIDGSTASAGEILSGALQDNKRAVLIGKTTFGKGKVQKIYNLMDGSGLNITVSKYLTPRGHDIDKKGIEPDILVDYTRADYYGGKDPQLRAAIKYLSRQESRQS